tara:strand:- start:109 stop:1083 length:975 start_codon:yes stop_codon:yes gene_type:complete
MDFPKKKEDKVVFKWTREQEELLAEWSEKAKCYRWLHARSEKLYRIRNYTFTIPVIILSTLTGTANFAMDSFVPEEKKQLAMAAVGSVNIFAGILSTLQNFLRYAELMESHRLSELQWSKFGRNIEVELALEPKRRKSAHDFLKVCRAEYDRLIEQSPTIDDKIIHQFKRAFKNVKICKPDSCNGMHKCKIYTPGKEEKAANLMANVTEKLSQKKKEQPSVYSHKQESIKELNSLMNLGKVSAFSKKANQIDTPSPTTSVLEQINEVKILIDDDVPDNDVEPNDNDEPDNDEPDNDGNNNNDNVDEPTEGGDSSEISTFLDGIK